MRVPNPTPAIKAAHAASGLPSAPTWAGYWTFVTATIIILFVLYLAKNNRLGVWLGFFSWTSPAAIGSTGATSTAATGAAGQTGLAGSVNSAVNSTGVGSAISAATGTPPLTIGGPIGSLVNKFLGGTQ